MNFQRFARAASARVRSSPRFRVLPALAALALAAVLSLSAGTVRAGGAVRIVALGDSLMAGYSLPPGAGFPDRLQAELRARGHDVTIHNAGVSGDTSRGGRARLDWSVGKDADAVMVELGANDALRGIDPKTTRKNLDAILGKLKAAGKKVLLIGMRAPPNMGEAYTEEFDRIYPELATKHGVLLYDFFLDGVASHPEFNLADGKHPNEKGIAIMVERILPVVEKLIAQTKK